MNILDMNDVISAAQKKSSELYQSIERKFNQPTTEILNGINFQQSLKDGAQHSPEVMRSMEARYGKG